MISEADFPHVFPWMPARSPAQEGLTGFEPPTPGCIARWEDEGGSILARPAGQPETPSDSLDRFRPLVALAVPPALALAVLTILRASSTVLPR